MSNTIDITETVWITMPDGTRLAARLWLPANARQEPVPVVMEYIPYRRRDRTRMRDEALHPRLAELGYAAIRVDTRGAGDSEGVMPDEYSAQEIQDGHDLVAWLADQDWCNGNVGMVGKSWGAFACFQVAATRPPALKAIVPVMGTDDRFREDIHFHGGCLAGDNFWWGAIMQLLNAAPPDPEIVGENWRAIWKERLEAMTFWPANWLEHQTRDDTWQRGSICDNYADVQVPVYYFGGWADLYRDTAFSTARHLKGPVKVMMGPWAHVYPHQATPTPAIDFIGELDRFFGHYLKGQETGIMDEPRMRFWRLDSVRPAGTHPHRPGAWIEEPRWPSPNITDEVLWLNETGLDAHARPGGTLSICSPQSFGSAAGDACSFGIAGDMPLDGRIDAGGALCLNGPPQDTPIDIVGQPRLEVKVAADRAQGFVVALLYDEAPDGAQTLISRGFANLTHRHSNTASQPVVPGEDMAITVPMHATAYRLPGGHRLTLQLASAYWPLLWPAPEPVTLSFAAGECALHLPVRQSDGTTPRPLAEPPEQPAPRKTQTGDGALIRSVETDLATGLLTHRLFIDGGVGGPAGSARLDETGTELGEISDRLYTIHPDDPLSAKATMTQESRFRRGDWDIHIKTHAEQTATKTDFHLKARVECWEGDTLFHEVDWAHVIPRNGM